MNYYWFYWLNIAHIFAAVIAVGPLALNPWLVNQVNTGDNRIIFGALHLTEIFYVRGGWFLIISGIALFYLTDWHSALHAWFMICVSLFIADSIVEKYVREPAFVSLAGHNSSWRNTVLRLCIGVWFQTASAYMILILMLIRPNLSHVF